MVLSFQCAGFTSIEYRHNIRMSEFSGDAPFKGTALVVRAGKTRLGRRQELDRDLSLKHGIIGEVDRALGPFSEFAEDVQSSK